LNECVSVFS